MASGDEVKVLGSWLSPFVIRARIALNLKGVDYEFSEETFRNQSNALTGPGNISGQVYPVWTKSELLLKSNPVYKKIPVLIHNGKPICESMIIVEYIDEFWSATGPALLPADPYDRAIARFWAVYIDDKWPAGISAFVRSKTEEAMAEVAEQLAAGVLLLEEAFEKSSKGKGFFGGDTIGYLDIAIGSFLGWIRTVEKMVGVEYFDEGKTPLLAGWAERFCSDAAVKELIPEIDKLVEYAKMRQATHKAAPPAN